MASKDIKYLNKDFDGFKTDLVAFAKTYYPNEYQDFNETSTGMMLLETVAYLGDVLSFYLDKQFKETFITTASERKNLIDRSNELGFVVRGNTSSTAIVTVYCEVDAISAAEAQYIPDETQAVTIKKNSEITADNGAVFRTTEDVVFSTKLGRLQAVSARDNNGVPTKFVLKKNVEVLGGKLLEKKVTVGAIGTKTVNDQVVVPEKGVHLEIPIDDENVVGIESVYDASDNEFFEVQYLAQDTVYASVINEEDDRDIVPQVLRLKRVPRRFITRYDENDTIRLIFGNGTENLSEEVLIANPGDVAIPLRGRKTFTASPVNPENFTRTNTMGILPQSTVLRIRYIKGGGAIANVPANSINTFSALTLDFNSSVTVAKQSQIRGSIAVTNDKPAIGGTNAMSSDEIRDNAASFFSAQDRCVTQEDFIVRAMTMPAAFGKVFRAYATADKSNNGVVQLYVLSRDANSFLVEPSEKIKTNLKEYLRNYRILTEQIEILSGLIINIGIDFSIVAKPDSSKNVVLSNCLLALKEYFKVDNWQIGQAIVISDIYEILHNIEGVLSVTDVKVRNLTTSNSDAGLTYSATQFTVMENNALGVITPPKNAIFYVKYPNNNLRGSVL